MVRKYLQLGTDGYMAEPMKYPIQNLNRSINGKLITNQIRQGQKMLIALPAMF